MKTVLHQVNSVPGMVGSMVCDETGRLLAHHFPPLFDTAMLEKAVSLVSESFPELQIFTGRESMADFRYRSGRIIVKPLNGGYLIMLCTPATNLRLLTISINVATARLDRLAKAASAACHSGMPDKPAWTAEGLMEEGQLAPSLKGMQTALARVVGPMAKVILIECIEAWCGATRPTRETLPQLVDLLTKEAERYGKGAAFVEMATPFLQRQ